jgi:hypothetical protein
MSIPSGRLRIYKDLILSKGRRIGGRMEGVEGQEGRMAGVEVKQN